MPLASNAQKRLPTPTVSSSSLSTTKVTIQWLKQPILFLWSMHAPLDILYFCLSVAIIYNCTLQLWYTVYYVSLQTSCMLSYKVVALLTYVFSVLCHATAVLQTVVTSLVDIRCQLAYTQLCGPLQLLQLCFCPKMASEAISEHPISKTFLEEHAPRPPSLKCYCMHIYTSELAIWVIISNLHMCSHY